MWWAVVLQYSFATVILKKSRKSIGTDTGTLLFHNVIIKIVAVNLHLCAAKELLVSVLLIWIRAKQLNKGTSPHHHQ